MSLTQPTCYKCNIKLGFSEQPCAYFFQGFPYCERHIDKTQKAIIDAAQHDADDRKLYDSLKHVLRNVSYENFRAHKGHYTSEKYKNSIKSHSIYA